MVYTAHLVGWFSLIYLFEIVISIAMLNCQKGMGNAVWMGRLSWAGKRKDDDSFLGREPWGELCMKCAVLDGSWRLSSTFESQGSRWFGQF